MSVCNKKENSNTTQRVYQDLKQCWRVLTINKVEITLQKGLNRVRLIVYMLIKVKSIESNPEHQVEELPLTK